MNLAKSITASGSQIQIWVLRGFWAITDQALFAGTNFLINVLLARWLEPAAYGAFALSYSVFLLLGTLHTALWTEPMLVYGSRRFRNSFVAYQRVLTGYHWRFGAVVAFLFLLFGLVFLVFGSRLLGLSFIGLTIAAPTVLYLWLVRRGFYVLQDPRWAALGGGLYLLLYLGFSHLLLRWGFLNEATAFLTMALAAILVAEVIRLFQKSEYQQDVSPQEVRSLHWTYGRWALLAGILSWVPANLPLVFLGITGGLQESAVLRAVYNLYMPVFHLQTALNVLFLPLIARKHSSSPERAWGIVKIVVGVHIFVASAFSLLSPVITHIVTWLYRGNYPEASRLFWVLLPAPFVLAFSNALEAWNRAADYPKAVVQAYGLASGVAMLLTPVLCYTMGTAGAAIAFVGAKVSLVIGLFVWRAR